MSKATHTLAFTAGCVIGVFALAMAYAGHLFRTCENTSENGGFTCSNCGSRTDYIPMVPFRFCPICGAAVMCREEM